MVGIVSSPVRAKRVFTQPRADQFIQQHSFLDSSSSLKGKLAVVTGAASGIGYYVAEQLAVKVQMAVVLVDRDMAKLKQARELIQVAAKDAASSTLGGSKEQEPKIYLVSYIADDLSLVFGAANDVRAIARSEHQSRLQLLIHLAPLEPFAGSTSQGVEVNYGRNFLAPFYFSDQLMGLMKAAATDSSTPPPRCIFSSAPLAKMPPINAATNLKDQIHKESNDDTAMQFYAASQVFLAAAVQYMTKRYDAGARTIQVSSIVTERGNNMNKVDQLNPYNADSSSSSLGKLYSYGSALLDYSPSQRAVPFLEAALGVEERKSVLEMDLPDAIVVTDQVAKETYFAAKSLRGKLLRSSSSE